MTRFRVNEDISGYYGGLGGEFNFTSDPEAVDIVLNQLNIEADKFLVVPLETCLSSNMTWVCFTRLTKTLTLIVQVI